MAKSLEKQFREALLAVAGMTDEEALKFKDREKFGVILSPQLARQFIERGALNPLQKKTPVPKTPWHVVLVYGEFIEPLRGQNSFLIRYPNRRMVWSKKLAPALDHLIQSWRTTKERSPWWLDGDTSWDAKEILVRYEWDGLTWTLCRP